MSEFKPDGSGIVTINICNWKGEIVQTEYRNLSECENLSFDSGGNEPQNE